MTLEKQVAMLKKAEVSAQKTIEDSKTVMDKLNAIINASAIQLARSMARVWLHACTRADVVLCGLANIKLHCHG
jgi:hypothetical protein